MRRTWLGLLVLLMLLLAGCGGGSTKTVTRTVTSTARRAPVLPPAAITAKPGGVASPAGEAPSCSPAKIAEVESGHGHIGVCAPLQVGFGGAPVPKLSGPSGPDVSNNDPFSDWRPVARRGHPFGYLKVIQGTRFVDGTARGMAGAQRSVGMHPGGYDFLEVCRTSPEGEAELYAHELAVDGLLRSGTFVPMGDAEWPLSVPCSTSAARSWLTRWQAKLHQLIKRWAGFYTGAWWWDPNVGCWRPPHGALRWVSGYIRRSALPIPCGWGGVDLWQYTDHGSPDGVHSVDMSVLEVSIGRFLGSPAPSPAQKRAAKLASLRVHERERRALHEDINSHHCRAGQHNTPRQPRRLRLRYHALCGRWLTRGGVVTGTVERLRRELHAGPVPVLR